MSASTAVAFDGVSRRFGDTLALDAVGLTIGTGETVALLGPNGAGKSTAIGVLRRAMEAGATGFLLKDAPAADLADAIRRVARGQRVVDPALAVAALSEGASPLSEREREVLALAATNGTVADIAARLGLSEGTVRNHLSAAIQKAGARNRAEAARIAGAKGWLAPEVDP